jgi:hypothetical protein
MNKWKSTITKINRNKFAFPKGWHTREEVAEQLECSAEKVAEIVAPGIKTGAIERNSFPVWDERLQRKVMVVGYRICDEAEAAPEVTGGEQLVYHRKLHRKGVLRSDGTVLWEHGKVTRPSHRSLKEDIRRVGV